MISSKTYILAIILLCSSCQRDSGIIRLNESIEINAHFKNDITDIKAGQEITIKTQLESNDINGETIQLYFNVGYQSYIVESVVIEDQVEFNIPASKNEQAGLAKLYLVYQNQKIGKSSVLIGSQKPTGVIESYNGPKTLFAQDDDNSMSVYIPHDRFQNPIIENAQVNFTKIYEGRHIVTTSNNIEHLVSFQENPPTNSTGKFLLGASVENSNAREQELIIEALMPEEIEIEVIRHYPYADARQYVHLRTKPVKDIFDNIVADGTMIHFKCLSEGILLNNYHSFTINGIANVFIENPMNKEDWIVMASSPNGPVSNKINLSFDPNTDEFELRYDISGRKLHIGPVFGTLGQLAPDGTQVKISIQGTSTHLIGYLVNGTLIVNLPFYWTVDNNSILEVLIGGHTEIISTNE